MNNAISNLRYSKNMPEAMLIIVYLLLVLLGLGLLMLLMSFVVMLVVRVPFVRTPKRATQALLDAKLIQPTDVVFDLGAGDGKFLHDIVTATGCRGEGFEISPIVWLLGEIRAATSKRWKMHLQNFLNVDLSEPTIIFNFLAPTGIPGLMQKLNTEVKTGQTVICYGYELPGWTPTQIIVPQPDRPTGSKFYVYKK